MQLAVEQPTPPRVERVDLPHLLPVAVHRPPFVGPDAELYEAAALMEECQVRLLPVVEDGRIMGIISRGDVLRGLAHRDGRPVATGVSVATSNGSGKPTVNASTVPLWELGGES